MKTDEVLLRPRQVATRLAVSYPTVWRMLKRGSLPCLRFSSRLLRVRESDLDEYLRACAVGGATSGPAKEKRGGARA